MNKSRSFAKEARKTLESRHRQTEEVSQILSGEGFKANVPYYESNPNLTMTEIQHQALSHEVDHEF